MLGVESMGGSAQAVATVGFVFAEAIVLHASYGALGETVGTTVIDTVGGD